jgi:hypothetical protein
VLEKRHGQLTVASTVVHTAVATLAILLRRRRPWIAALALSVGVAPAS